MPLPKRCKLKPEDNLHPKLIPEDGNCIANCFAVHFEKNLAKVLDKLGTEFRINLHKSTDNFLNIVPRKL